MLDVWGQKCVFAYIWSFFKLDLWCLGLRNTCIEHSPKEEVWEQKLLTCTFAEFVQTVTRAFRELNSESHQFIYMVILKVWSKCDFFSKYIPVMNIAQCEQQTDVKPESIKPLGPLGQWHTEWNRMHQAHIWSINLQKFTLSFKKSKGQMKKKYAPTTWKQTACGVFQAEA